MPPLDRLGLTLGEWFGCGRSRFAPGTVGALGTLPLYVCLREAPTWSYWLVSLTLCAIGLWASEVSARVLGEKDPGRVVIDEVAGTLLALGCVRGLLVPEILAFGLFRLLDITKPGPIDRVQYWKPSGLGIMIDDILAGLCAGALARGAAWLLAHFMH